MELVQNVFPTTIWQEGDHTDFVPEKTLGLRCLTKISATCVVVDVSKYLNILTLELSMIPERPPF